MADFYEAATNTHPDGIEISVHALENALRDHVLGGVSKAGILAAVQAQFLEAGGVLSVAGVVEVETLVDDIDAAGTATQQLIRAIEWGAVIGLAREGKAYTTVTALRARMGV